MLLVNMFHLCLDLIDYVRYSAEFNVYRANWYHHRTTRNCVKAKKYWVWLYEAL